MLRTTRTRDAATAYGPLRIRDQHDLEQHHGGIGRRTGQVIPTRAPDLERSIT